MPNEAGPIPRCLYVNKIYWTSCQKFPSSRKSNGRESYNPYTENYDLQKWMNFWNFHFPLYWGYATTFCKKSIKKSPKTWSGRSQGPFKTFPKFFCFGMSWLPLRRCAWIFKFWSIKNHLLYLFGVPNAPFLVVLEMIKFIFRTTKNWSSPSIREHLHKK